MNLPKSLPRRVEDNSCLSCRQPSPNGEWYCPTCQARRTRQATKEEAEAAGYGKAPVPAKGGTTENQQYSGDHPLAQGRVGPFSGKPHHPNADIDGDYAPGQIKDSIYRSSSLLTTSVEPMYSVGETIGDLTITSRPLKSASEKDTLWS